MKRNNQRTCTCFLDKYGGKYLYDIDSRKIYSIDDEHMHFVKGYEYNFISNPYHPDGTSTDHEYFAFIMTCSTES